jgi:hypothetical protein
MLHHPLAAAQVTGSHPGPAFYMLWALIIGAVIGAPIYVAHLVRERRKRR